MVLRFLPQQLGGANIELRWQKIAEGTGFRHGGEESRVLWSNVLEKNKEWICNVNEFCTFRKQSVTR